MPELSRRDYLVLVAGGVGAAAGIGEVTERREAVAVPAVGDVGEGVSGAIGGGGVAGDANFETAATLAGVPASDVVAQIEFVTGNNRNFGVHVTYEGDLPINAEGDGYELGVVEALGDERNPDRFPQFVFCVGDTRDYGTHVKQDSASGQVQHEDEFTLAFADTLAGMASPDITPQYEFVLGDNRDHGTHVRTA